MSQHQTKRQVVLDTETTGLSTAEDHRIIEIGCVELINRRQTGETFHQYINPDTQQPHHLASLRYRQAIAER